jgi:hypothetical protein
MKKNTSAHATRTATTVSAYNQTLDPAQLPEVKWEFITPELAKEYLAKNTANRQLVPSDLEKLERDLAHEALASVEAGWGGCQ